jgi:GNAT superfamily N-acetyltransferase
VSERTGSREHIDVTLVPLEEILEMREAYRRQMNCQIVHDSWHERGFTDSYLLRVHDKVVGYGSVGGAPRDTKDIVKEFYVQPASRAESLPLFRQLIATSGARRVEAQTNDSLLLLMLHDCVEAPWSETILFADGALTSLRAPAGDVVLRRITDDDQEHVFPHTVEPVGEWGLESKGELVATGGLAFHYNPPYGDIYMEVAAAYRMMGFGSYLVQELKRICYEMECVPSARCNQTNVGSRRTLQRAGMFPCARIVQGEFRA